MLSSLLISLAAVATPVAPSSELVAVKAGTIHAVEGGRVITGGGTVLIRDGKIVGVGEDEDLPAGVRVVDYGPSAVIVPGLVAVDSAFGSPTASDRTAEPGLAAVDGFDPYGDYLRYLAHGVTTAYVAPARNRLIAGNGAVVKLGGAPGESRVLSERAAIHGSISEDARRTPGYWEPPVPATVDVGLGIFAAAKALDLDFIPVVTEEYDLVIPQEHFESARIQMLMDIINSQTFKKRVAALGGYATDKTGQVIL